ncbi:MAG: hypothetical protein HC906_14440 [Bacteroidales bacterium]|nr:hypothetical protein [Bacteroidales bacterium]
MTENYDLGRLTGNKDFGKISMNISATGFSPSGKSVNANITGNVGLLEVKKYQYQNINIAGILENNKYDGSVTIKDPNLDFEFHGLIDFSEESAQYNFCLCHKSQFICLAYHQHRPI